MSAIDTGDAWSTRDVPDEALRWVGAVGRVTSRSLDHERVTVFGDLTAPRPNTSPAVSLVTCCPDPIVVACASGLPRLRMLDRAIDGGTHWQVRRALRLGDRVHLVPRVAGVHARRASDGRRMLRTVYEVVVHASDGVVVGTVRGTSLDIEASR